MTHSLNMILFFSFKYLESLFTIKRLTLFNVNSFIVRYETNRVGEHKQLILLYNIAFLYILYVSL